MKSLNSHKQTFSYYSMIGLTLLTALIGSLLILDGALQPREAAAGTITCSSGVSGCHFNPAVKDGTGRNVPDGRFVGTHQRHSGYSTSSAKREYKFACSNCHYNNTTNNHMTGFKNITGSSLPGASYTRGKRIANEQTVTAFGNCNNIYCHSNGRQTGMGTKQYSSVRWGGTEGCRGCHGGRNGAAGAAARSIGGFTLSTTHSQHLNKYAAGVMNCQICHSKTATDAATLKSYTGVNYHVNGKADVVFTNIAYGSYTSYKSTKNCSNTSCHGGSTRNTWSSSAQNTNHQCTHCHGVGTGVSSSLAVTGANRYNLRYFAPGWNKSGTSTDQTASSNDLRVGSHFKHLSSAYMKNIKCNECHYVPSNPIEIGTNHDLNKLRFNSGTLTFSQSSSAMISIGVASGSLPAKLSAFSGYTNGTANKAATCSSLYCHGNRLKTADTSGSVRKPYWNYSAMINYTDANTSCGRCHGNPPTAGSSATIHNAYIGQPTVSCANCHSNMVNASGKITNKALHINGVVDIVIHAAPYFATSAGHQTCTSGIGCHQNSASPPAYSWTGAAPNCQACHRLADPTVSTNGCGSCHGAPNGTGEPNGAVHPNDDGSHPKHTILSAGTCTACHGIGGTGTNANHGPSKTGTNIVDITASLNWNSGAATCTNIYCHSTGQAADGTAAVTYAASAPVWGTTVTDCGSCHKNMDSDAAAPGDHVIHAQTNNISCATCHSGYTETTAAVATHANQLTEVTFTGNAAGTTYSQAGQAVGNGYGTCSTSYCHSSGQSTTGGVTPVYPGTAPTWGTGTMNCGSCHLNMDSNASAPGSHVKHAQTYPISCATCHSGYTETTVNIPTHVNKIIELTFSGTLATGTSYSQGNSAVGNGYGNCSASYCHSNGRQSGMGTKQYSSARWGGTEGCLGCHGGRNASGVATRSVGGFTLSTTHSQHLNKYAVGVMNCQICHSKTAASAIALKQYTGVQRHVNGVADVVFTDIAYGSYTSYKSTKNCANTSCHGGNTRNVWSATAQNTNHQCTHCHGVGTGVSSTLAVTGVNRYNLRYFAPGWNKSGTSTDQTASSNDKRVGSHFKHLSSAYMRNIKCNECHYVPTNPIEIGTNHDLNKLRFNSGTLTFSQSSTAMISIGVASGSLPSKLAAFSGYTNGTANKAATCSSLYCHGSRLKTGDTSGSYRKPYWNYSAMINYTDTTTSCGRCHGNPPTTGTSATTHNPYIGNQASCSTCHTDTVNSAGKIIDKTKHINGIVEVSSHDWPYPGATHMLASGAVAGQPYTGCTGCHTNGLSASPNSYPFTARNMATVTCFTCHKNSANFNSASHGCADCHGDSTGRPSANAAIGNVFPNVSGNHGKHMALSGVTCNTCHYTYGSGAADHGSSGNVLHDGIAYVGLSSASGQFHATKTTTATCATNVCHVSATWGVTRLGCNGCHGYDVSGGVWTSGLTGGVSGAHYKHIAFIKTRLSIANLTPLGQTFGVGEPAQVCGTCHTNTALEHSMTTNPGTRQISFGTGGTTYTMGAGTASSMSLLFGSSNPVATITTARSNVTCSNLICHYATTPNWY